MFERSLELIDINVLNKIKETKIFLVGLGGVGGICFEALVRLGFTNITIVDNDKFELSNLNRQILSLTTNLGENKSTVAFKRALAINPAVQIKELNIFLNKDNLENILSEEKYDYIIDACDTITTKIELIKYAKKHNLKIISCLGTGNRFNPSLVEITTLAKTNNDSLAKVMRNLLKKENISLDIPVVWSKEIPIKTKKRTPGSLMLTPASAGLNLAYYVLNDILKTI